VKNFGELICYMVQWPQQNHHLSIPCSHTRHWSLFSAKPFTGPCFQPDVSCNQHSPSRRGSYPCIIILCVGVTGYKCPLHMGLKSFNQLQGGDRSCFNGRADPMGFVICVFWSREWSNRRAWWNSETVRHNLKCRPWRFGPFVRKIKCLATTKPRKLGSVIWSSERGQCHSSLRNVVKNLIVAEFSCDPSNCASFLLNLHAAKLPTEQNAPTAAVRYRPALITCQEAYKSPTRAP
jgi:hypothetical protein